MENSIQTSPGGRAEFNGQSLQMVYASQSTGKNPASYLDDERFSQRLELQPEASEDKPFVVTYADFGYRSPEHPETERVLLFCSPLMGSRWLHVSKDELAKRHHVRIIVPDRPGFGQTTNVPIADRIAAWLKIVPPLLEHLNIRHVSLASHSAGHIYALSTLLHLRHLLHPTKPYVALCAPWVHPSHTDAPLGKLLMSLPVPLVNQFDHVERFVNTKISPVIGFSTGLSTGASASLGFGNKKRLQVKSAEDIAAIELEERLIPKILARCHRESVEGLSSEALLLLKRDAPDNVWGDWLDVDRYVPQLAAIESSKERYATSASLSIEVFFGESDVMIGTGPGPRWLDECWRLEQRGDLINYRSRVVKETNHDNILNIEFGIMEHIFSNIPEHGD